MNTKAFALILGVVFLAVGVLGFVPAAVQPYSGPALSFDKNQGDLLGLFPVNLLHNCVHLLFGVLGVMAFMSGSAASKTFAQVVGVAYILLAILGAVPVDIVRTTFGFIPIHGNDIWLHALIGVVASYVGFAAPAPKLAM
jgi:Domain of unknown function (DUF4383)